MHLPAVSFSGRIVAVTGARTFLGGALLRLLEADDRYQRIIALDVQEPPHAFERAEFHQLDLVSPDAQRQLATLLTDADVDTLVHAAFLSRPTRATAWAHELEDVGTMQVLAAASAAEVSRVVMTSTTLVYGASRHNPVELRESWPLDAGSSFPFIADKVEAEKQLARFAEAHRSIAVSALRFAPIFGPTCHGLVCDILSRPVIVKLLGFDPLVQLTDESDAGRALKLAVDTGQRAVFNIASRGVLPLSTIALLLGSAALPVPASVLRPLAKLMWRAQLSSAPPEMADFLRYVCVGDTTASSEVLGFRARYHIRELIAGAAREHGTTSSAMFAGAMH